MPKHLSKNTPSKHFFQALSLAWIKCSYEGKIISGNPQFIKLLAYPDQVTLFKTNFWSFFANNAVVVQAKGNLEEGENILNLVTQFNRYTGSQIWVRLTFIVGSDKTQNKSIIECVAEDITNFKQLEIELARSQASARKQHILADVLGRMILSTSIFQELSSLLKLLCSEAINLLEMNSAQIWLLQDNVLTGVTACGPGQNSINDLQIPLSNTDHIAIQVLNKKIPLFLSGIQKNSKAIHNGFGNSFQICSMLVAPLIIAGRATGVLFLIDEQKNRNFEGDDLELSMLLANQTATVVENAQMFDRLKIANATIAGAYDATLAGWAKALELRDLETEGHTQRVAKFTIELAKKFELNDDMLTQIYRGALLHDIGKMGIPDEILLKPGPLSESEQAIMRLHPIYAYEMLKSIEYLQSALDIPYCHHEKWDGSGYPQGLKGEEIPLVARIFSVVDVWDALNSNRPYRDAWSRNEILELIRSDAGKHFDPKVVEKFFELVSNWS